MTVDEVANAVGIAKASLYKHFPSKEDLCRCGHGQDDATVRAYLATIAADRAPLDKLRDVVRWTHGSAAGTNEMPSCPASNSSLRATLMGNKAYMDGLVDRQRHRSGAGSRPPRPPER
jgi:AcrR family transcriptional regulator